LRKFIFVLLIFLSLVNSAYAVELVSIIDGSCNLQKGLIIHVSQKEVFLTGQDGLLIAIERSKIKALFLHEIKNPIPEVRHTDYLMKVRIQEASNGEFYGWPIKFFDDLIIFSIEMDFKKWLFIVLYVHLLV